MITSFVRRYFSKESRRIYALSKLIDLERLEEIIGGN